MCVAYQQGCIITITSVFTAYIYTQLSIHSLVNIGAIREETLGHHTLHTFTQIGGQSTKKPHHAKRELVGGTQCQSCHHWDQRHKHKNTSSFTCTKRNCCSRGVLGNFTLNTNKWESQHITINFTLWSDEDKYRVNGLQYHIIYKLVMEVIKHQDSQWYPTHPKLTMIWVQWREVLNS